MVTSGYFAAVSHVISVNRVGAILSLLPFTKTALLLCALIAILHLTHQSEIPSNDFSVLLVSISTYLHQHPMAASFKYCTNLVHFCQLSIKRINEVLSCGTPTLIER